jgi:hypothetical protein
MCPSQIENAGIGLPSVEAQTVARLLTGHHTWEGIGRAVLIDCRYDYEHTGGCITGAVNMQVCPQPHFPAVLCLLSVRPACNADVLCELPIIAS